MTVKELKEILSKYDENENVYIWNGNWPTEHYTTHIKVDTTTYGSVLDEHGKIIYSPLIIH